MRKKGDDHRFPVDAGSLFSQLLQDTRMTRMYAVKCTDRDHCPTEGRQLVGMVMDSHVKLRAAPRAATANLNDLSVTFAALCHYMPDAASPLRRKKFIRLPKTWTRVSSRTRFARSIPTI